MIAEGYSGNIDGGWIRRREIIPYPKEYPYSPYIYPSIFAQCGLTSIEVHALASSYYSRDQKWTEEDAINEVMEWLKLLGENRERYEANLKRVGWQQDRIEALFKAWNDYHKEIPGNSQKTLQEHSV